VLFLGRYSRIISDSIAHCDRHLERQRCLSESTVWRPYPRQSCAFSSQAMSPERGTISVNDDERASLSRIIKLAACGSVPRPRAISTRGQLEHLRPARTLAFELAAREEHRLCRPVSPRRWRAEMLVRYGPKHALSDATLRWPRPLSATDVRPLSGAGHRFEIHPIALLMGWITGSGDRKGACQGSTAAAGSKIIQALRSRSSPAPASAHCPTCLSLHRSFR